jgi:hypothetical protein
VCKKMTCIFLLSSLILLASYTVLKLF